MNQPATDAASVFSGLSLVALFPANQAATPEEIAAAIGDAKTYGEVADQLISRTGVIPRLYANQQPVFGPLVRLLSLAGWTLSGSGYFSVAFHKGGLALKLGLRVEDDAAKDYAVFCRNNDHLPGVPYIHAMGEFDNSYVVLMERYTPITGELDQRSALYDPHIKCEFDEVKAGVETGLTLGQFATSRTACTIHELFSGAAHFDIHSGNVMLDREGRLIITDPIGRSRADCSNDYQTDCAATCCADLTYCVCDTGDSARSRRLRYAA